MSMRKITNSQGEIEYIISSEEKTIFEIAIRNLAMSVPSLVDTRGVELD